jgi:hypothetical protein
MKSNYPFISAIIWVILVGGITQAIGQGQPLKKLQTISVKGIKNVTIDRLGNIYTQLENQTINKYDTDGNWMASFSNLERIEISQIEPWNPLSVFIFSSPIREIELLDRSLIRLERISVDQSLAIEPSLACPSSNNTYWLFDRADLTLKKIDLKSSGVDLQIELNKVARSILPNYIALREYQNMIFLIDLASGIEIYSIVGKRIHKIEAPGISYFGFLGQELYYLEAGNLKFYDLYTEELHQFSVGKVKQALATDERLILVNADSIEIFEYKPSR